MASIVINPEDYPPHLTAPQLDAVIFYSQKDRDKATNICERLTKLGQNVALYDDDSFLDWKKTLEFDLVDELCQRATYKIFLITEELVNDHNINFHKGEAIMESLLKGDGSVLPVFYIQKSDFPQGSCFTGWRTMTGLYPDDSDRMYKLLFDMKDVQERKRKREEDQQKKLKQWIEDEIKRRAQNMILEDMERKERGKHQREQFHKQKTEFSSHEIKLAIRKNYVQLIQDLDSEPLIIELFARDVLALEEKEHLSRMYNNKDRNDYLLTLILKKEDTTLQIFFEVLKRTHGYIYEALDKTIEDERSVVVYYRRVHPQSKMETSSVEDSHESGIGSLVSPADSIAMYLANVGDQIETNYEVRDNIEPPVLPNVNLPRVYEKEDQSASSVADSHESGIGSLVSPADSIATSLANIGDQIETNYDVYLPRDYEAQSGGSPGDMDIPQRLRSQSSPVRMSHDEGDSEVAYIRSQSSAPYGSKKTLELKALPQVMDTSEEEDKEELSQESKDTEENICAKIPGDKDEKIGYFRIFDSKHKDKLEVHIPESVLKRGQRVEDIQIYSREVIHIETIGSDTPINSASPVYEFLPHGTVFKEPVLIKFPIKMNGQFGLNGLRMLYSNTAQHEPEKWVDICPNDETHKDMSWLVLDGTVYLWTSHFSKFTMVYTTGDKVPFRVLLYVDRDDEHMEAKLTVSFSCYCESQHLMKKLQKYGELVDEQSMPIDKKEGQVEISLNPNPFCAENWSLMDTSYKDLVYKDVLLSVCALNALPPHTSYKMYSKTGKFNRNSIVSVRVQQLPDGQNLCKPVLRWYMGEVLPRRTLMGSFLSGFWWLINKTFQWFTTWLFGFFQLKPLQRNVLRDRDDNIQNKVKQNKSVVDAESESSDVEQDNPSPVVQPDSPDIQPDNPRSDMQPDNPRSDIQPDNSRSDIQPDNSDGCLDNFGMLECDGIEPRVYHTSACSQTVHFRYRDNSSCKTPNGTLLDVNPRSGANGDSDHNSHNIGVLPASHLPLTPSGDINGASGSMEEHIPEELYIAKNRLAAVALKPYRPQDVVPRDIPALNYASMKTLNIQYIINTNNDSNISSFDTEYEKYFPEEFGRDFYCYMLDFILELRNNEETLTKVITAAGAGPLRNPYPEYFLCAWYESRRSKSSNIGFERKIWLPEFWCVLRNAGQQSLAKKLVGALEKVALKKERPTFEKRLNDCDTILSSLSSARVITDDKYTELLDMSEHLNKKRAKIISAVLSGRVEAIDTFKEILDETEQNDLLKAIQIDTSKFEEM